MQRIPITSRPENHIQSVFNDAPINSLGQDMAGIEDETMLDTDVVDLEGMMKQVFPSELRYARALLSTILQSSFFYATPHCKDST